MPILKTDEQFFDIRLVDRNIKKGVAKEKDYEKYLKSLNDCEYNLELITKELIFDEFAVPKEEFEDSEEDSDEDSDEGIIDDPEESSEL